MPRRGRRTGVRFIEDDRDRSLTYFKRRAGLFKSASDLSTLTGAKVAVVLESENGRFSSFGTPEASPVVDAFLSGHAPTNVDTSAKQKATITNLQNELFQLEKDKVMEEKRMKETIARTKEVQETSKMAKYVYGKVEDLNATELSEMYRELLRIKQEIKQCLPTLGCENQAEASDCLRDPSLLLPSWWRSTSSQAMLWPRCSTWPPSQPSLYHLGSSVSMIGRSGSPLSNSLATTILPSHQLQPKPMLQHPIAPHPPSMVRFQTPNMSLSKLARRSYFHTRGLNININESPQLSSSPVSHSPTAQTSPLQTPPSNASSPIMSPRLSHSQAHNLDPQQLSSRIYNLLQERQKNMSASSSSMHFKEPCNSSLYVQNVETGNMGANGGQTSYGGNNGVGLFDPIQGQGWTRVTSSESSSAGGSFVSGDEGNNISDLNFH